MTNNLIMVGCDKLQLVSTLPIRASPTIITIYRVNNMYTQWSVLKGGNMVIVCTLPDLDRQFFVLKSATEGYGKGSSSEDIYVDNEKETLLHPRGRYMTALIGEVSPRRRNLWGGGTMESNFQDDDSENSSNSDGGEKEFTNKKVWLWEW